MDNLIIFCPVIMKWNLYSTIKLCSHRIFVISQHKIIQTCTLSLALSPMGAMYIKNASFRHTFMLLFFLQNKSCTILSFKKKTYPLRILFFTLKATDNVCKCRGLLLHTFKCQFFTFYLTKKSDTFCLVENVYKNILVCFTDMLLKKCTRLHMV